MKISEHLQAHTQEPGRIGDLPVRRRSLIKAFAVGGGLMLGCGSLPSVAGTSKAAATNELEFNAFLRITPDSQVIVVVKHLDMGQGVSTGLPTLVAEELDADWRQVSWEHAPADATRYNNLFFGPSQGTGGSTAIANSWEQMRKAGAAARAMLAQAAADLWQVPLDEINITKGVVSHGRKTATFGDLVTAAVKLPVPDSPKLKVPKDFSLIGKTIPHLDTVDKITGTARYTQDVYLPNMLTALVLYPPKILGKVKKINAEKARQVPGIVAVVEITRGVAVVAEGFWPAYQARQLLDVEWDLSACETRSSDQLFSEFSEAAQGGGTAVRDDGDLPAAFEQAASVVEAEYRLPYLYHATMEPMNCVALVTDESCELWYGCQMQTGGQRQAASVTGHKPEQVKINTLYAGGSFGRRAAPDDFVADTAAIAKQFKGRPVKLVWTREDDIGNGRFRPMAVHRLKGAVSDGKALAWQHHAVAQPIFRATGLDGFIQGPIDNTIIEGISDTPYAIPNLLVEATEKNAPTSILWWRSVGHSGNAFVMETFMDQLAKAAGRDPVEFRLELLTEHPRYLGVLKLVAEQAEWSQPLPSNRGRGVAVHKAMGSWCAQVAEVTVNDDGGFSVDRVVCAIDCGIAVNPGVIRAQMEGSIGFGLSAALGEEVTLENGNIVQSNFDGYQLLRMAQMPKVEVHIVASAEPPTGVGEPGVPPIAPAVANALFAATGKPITRLPIRM